MNPALMSLTAFKRPTFTGRTDKFAPPVSPFSLNEDDLRAVLKAVSPGEVGGSVLSDGYAKEAISRISGYANSWDYYEGRHFRVEPNDGLKKVATNFCKMIVDKRAAWAVGKKFKLTPEKGNELVAKTFESAWRANGGRELLHNVVKTSHITGDGFMYFTLRSKDLQGNPLPVEEQSVRIVQLNPAYVFPVWRENEPTEMAACYLHFPIWDDSSQNSASFTAFITPKVVKYYINGQAVKSHPNKLGRVNVVHVPSETLASNVFGTSILKDIIPLNDAYNEARHSVRKIIKYHGEPTTLVFGTRFANMERGANRLWSNLPAPGEADVRNLEMKGDLSQFKLDFDETEKHIYKLGKTPRVAFDSDGLAISNTSGIAMALLFQPLIEASLEMQGTLARAITQGNAIIAKFHSEYFGEDLSELADDPDSYLENEVSFESMLPKDLQMEMDLVAKQLELQLISKAEAMRRLRTNDNSDSEKLALEIAADANSELAYKAEEYKALQGQCPNFTATLLGSPFLHEDLVDIAQRIPKSAGVDKPV
jgi:hypothetical protein